VEGPEFKPQCCPKKDPVSKTQRVLTQKPATPPATKGLKSEAVWGRGDVFINPIMRKAALSSAVIREITVKAEKSRRSPAL
jgi:hypothetical protein